MNLFFGRRPDGAIAGPAATREPDGVPLPRTLSLIAALTGVLVFSRAGCPCEETLSFVSPFASWGIVALCAAAEAAMLVGWFGVRWWKPVLVSAPVIALAIMVPDDPKPAFLAGVAGFSILLFNGGGLLREWFEESLSLTIKVLPLLLAGVAASGFLLGTSDSPGIIPFDFMERLCSGSQLTVTLAASVSGAFMYFATLTEVPIVQGPMRSGMASGPALALLLAGPALSLSSMLVIRSVIGTGRTAVYVLLVIAFSTAAGLIYGAAFPG